MLWPWPLICFQVIKFAFAEIQYESMQFLLQYIEYFCLSRIVGSITCIEFYKHTHMFSNGEDGLLCVWNAVTMECLISVYCELQDPSHA